MKTSMRACLSLYIIVISVIIANLFFGAKGIAAYSKMDKYKNEIEKNISELRGINNELLEASDKLIKEPEEIVLQARHLGWVEKGEGTFILKGLTIPTTGYAMGKLLSHDFKEINNSRSYIIISILVGLIFYVLSGILTEIRLSKKNA
ncbi:MAG: septum formation initiator family protein [Spirochaetales bacterium]|nr:septum formation initiator family protein [Spirochaetales bacterium]